MPSNNGQTSTVEWCRGRWGYLLRAFGIEERYLTNIHGPCPLCGGDDRFRYDDKDGRGTWFCNGCGNGDGFDLLTRFTGREFKDLAAEIVTSHMKFAPERNDYAFVPDRSTEQKRQALNRAWSDAKAPKLVHEYLTHRGINPEILSQVSDLRGNMEQLYVDDKTKARDRFPAMLAMVRGPKGEAIGIHRTYLLPDGTRHKKMMSPIQKMTGGAIRLIPPTNGKLLVAEGIESALAARQLLKFRGGVWAGGSASGLMNMELPKGLERILVCADHDESFTGQMAAYTLARTARLKHKLKVCVAQPADMNKDMADALSKDSVRIIATKTGDWDG